MADNLQRLLVQMQGWAGLLETNWPEIIQWMEDLQNGHPKAQDFEPTGHGGSDPTSVNGIRPDMAAQDRKGIEADIRGAWRFLDSAIHRANRYHTATRPKRQPDDLSDIWCVLHLAQGYEEPRAHLDLCDPCYRFKCNRGRYPLPAEVTHYVTHYGRWPKQRIDPKQHTPKSKRVYIAGLENLQAGAATLEVKE